MTKIMMTWVLFIIFFVLTQPSGSARYLDDWYNGIRGAGRADLTSSTDRAWP